MASRAEEKQRRREERQQAEAAAAAMERRQRLIKVTSAAVFLAVIGVVVAIIVSQSGGNSAGGNTQLEDVGLVKSELAGIPQSGPVIGDPKVKTTLIMYGDLQCPVCKEYSETVIPQLIDGPVKAGQLKLEFRPWTVISSQSNPAAAAAYAAGQQGRFWNYTELFYRNQGEEGSGYVTDDFMTAIAKGAGVASIAKWNQDRKNPHWMQLLDQHNTQAHDFGFTGTPSFAVDSAKGLTPISGLPQPTLSTFESVIKQAS
jgi:protein-disulfide isomerase